jgi:hypothetical protein
LLAVEVEEVIADYLLHLQLVALVAVAEVLQAQQLRQRLVQLHILEHLQE